MEGGFDIGSVIAHIKADLSGFTAAMDSAKEQLASVGSAVSNVADNIKSFAEQGSLFVGLEGAAFGGLAKQAIDVASNFEQTQTSFGTLLGSEQKAADLMQQIMQFEQHTPFDIQTLTDAAKQMLAFGVNAADVVPKLKMLTDMSQGQSSKLQELVSIYGQVNSIQQLNGREVLRLSSIGVPIYQALEDHFNKMGGAAVTASVSVNAFGETVKKVSKDNADQLANANTKLAEENAQLKILQEEHPKAGLATEKHTLAVQKLQDQIAKTTTTIGDHTISLKQVGGQANVTAEEIKNMVSKGEISSEVFNEVLTEMTSKGGLFFQENIRQMSTFSGIMSSTQSQLQYAILNLIGIDIGAANEVRKGGLFDTLRSLAASLLDWLHQLQPVLKSIGENKTFQLAIEGLVIAIGSLIIILPALLVAMNPVFLAVIAIQAAIIALYVAWNTNFLGIRNITTTVINYLIGFWKGSLLPALNEIKDWWKSNGEYIVNFLVGVWYAIEGIFQIAIALILLVVRGGLDLLTANWKDAWKTVQDVAKIAWDGVQHILEGALIMVTNMIGLIVQHMVQPFEDAWNKINDTMNKVKGAVDFTQRHSPSVIDIIENGVSLANNALGKLAFNNQFTVNPQAAFAGAFSSGVGAGTQVVINLDGAVIADSQSASRIGEVIGDAMIRKLKLNIRI